MEFVIDQQYFNKTILDVSKAVSAKTPFPILTGIKIVANKTSITLTGSNSDIVIEKTIPLMSESEKILEVSKTGSVVVSAKYLSEIVKKMPNQIHIKVNEKHQVTIRSNEIVTRMNGFSADDYPILPQIDKTIHLTIPSFTLIESIKQTVFAVSKTESRPVLTGVNMSFNERHLTFIATNSHRLALRKLAIEETFHGSYIVPSTSLLELIKLINNEAADIHLCFTENYVMFQSNTFSLFSRLIEGNYPNVSGLIPTEAKTILSANTVQLREGIERACIFASEWRNNNVNLEIKDGKMIKISSISTEIGNIEETQKVNKLEGDTALSISLDGSFLIEALKEIKEKEVRLSFSGTMRPILIEPIGNPDYFHLISPVRSF